ncbi:MAG TPA: glycine cleavage T C-terminal barrel domain-containing protein [Chthoniobacterales bacterium]|jgi:folate-binding protein YgfZ
MTPLLDLEQRAFFDFSSRVKLRLAGPDSLRFLNGQITNDLRKTTGASALQASLLNAKGKLSAHVFISAESDSFLMDAEPELREALPARIDRYIIADDVQIEDLTDRFALFHVTGEQAPASSEQARILQANRFGCCGWDIWVERAREEAVRKQFSSLFFCDEECAEVFRIERGIPKWGRELTDQIIPNEANLEASSIDYSKGCYIGQEVISRMKMSGQTNKRLCGLVSVSCVPLQPGMRLLAGNGEGKEIGWITSSTHSPRLEKEIALGYVKRGFNSLGTNLQAGTAESAESKIAITVVALPFV